jgi:hypothetical protein
LLAPFWILDFGFWIEGARPSIKDSLMSVAQRTQREGFTGIEGMEEKEPKTQIQNPKS